MSTFECIIDDERLAFVKEQAQRGITTERDDVLELIARLEKAEGEVESLAWHLEHATKHSGGCDCSAVAE